jgi:signal transduction histidine kinase
MPLAVRLLLVLLMPMMLCFGGYAYVNVRLRRQEMLVEAHKEVRDHGAALEVALDAFLRDRNLDDVVELTQDLSRADRILGVLIYDDHDRAVHASRSVVAMQPVLLHLAQQARATRQSLLETLPRGESTVYAYAFPIGTDDGHVPRGAGIVLRDLGYIEDNLEQSARRIALAGVLTMLVVAVATWLVLRLAVLRPLATLVGGVERVASGALDAEVPIERRDEIGRMATAFNGMTRSLRAAREELEAKNQANVALERRLHHAQRLALIGQLSASVAHRIGSPLNVILGRARYALKQGGQSERDGRHFQEIAAGAESISGVIEQLLSQARRVRGRVGPVDVGELVQHTVRFLEAECERVGITTRVRAEPGVVVEVIRDELEQVILNLCLNAIQAQPSGGRLEIDVARRDGTGGASTLELTVADAGTGVPPELRARIFDAFFTTKPAPLGTGLGLAICEEIVRGQGGTIAVSDAPCGGALFRVTLPLRRVREHALDAEGRTV